MLIKKNDKPSLIEIEVDGKVTEEDMAEFEEYVKQKKEQCGKLNALIEIKDLNYTTEGLIEEIKFDATHLDDFDKVAIVSDKKWIDLGEKLVQYMPSLDTKHFDSDERQKAVAWLS